MAFVHVGGRHYCVGFVSAPKNICRVSVQTGNEKNGFGSAAYFIGGGGSAKVRSVCPRGVLRWTPGISQNETLDSREFMFEGARPTKKT